MLRLVASFGLVSGWLALLLLGHAFGGAVFVLLAGGLALFPWPLLKADPEEHPAGDAGSSPTAGR